MKISLITYYYSCNHGAVMQTYALCRYLKELGHNVELVDLRQDEGYGSSFLVRLIKPIIFKYRINRIKRQFYPQTSKRYFTISDLREDPPKADCYMVGSDQVWNPNISKSLQLAYFLDYGNANVPRISYASSFGLEKWPGGINTDRIKSLLARFDSLSTREVYGKKICKETFNVEADVVLDPTFLNTSYDEFNYGVKQTNDFVCYKLNRTSDFWANVSKVGEIVGAKPLLLNYNYPKKGFKYCFPPSLRTWMRKFAGAKFILTDSFHGIAFSIINRKQFVAILNDDGKNSRLINLMECFGLSNRVYKSVAEMLEDDTWRNPINYSAIEEVLKEKIEFSRNFIKKSLISYE